MPVSAVATAALLRVVLVALAIFATPVGRAFAEPVLLPDLADRVDGREDVTFADLVRLVVSGTPGNETIAVREIGTAVVEDLEPAAAAALRLAATPVRSGGLDRMALLLDFGRGRDVVGLAVLAIVDMAGTPKLLDAANVATGEHTSFLDPARMRVGMNDELLATRSMHFNSSQSYTTTHLILARNDRLELVDTIFTFGERLCAFERTQQLDIRQGAGAPMADIRATVTETTFASDEQCGDTAAPEPGTRAIAVTYHWDTTRQRYIADSDALAALARQNEDRF